MKKVRHAFILGMGTSGEAAARVLMREGCQVTLVDRKISNQLRQRAEYWKRQGARVQIGCNDLSDLETDLAVVSPGIPVTDSWIQGLRSKGIRLISELELGWSHRNCPIIAVTGSNGKSTAVKLLCHLLRQAGMAVLPAGNFGPPLCSQIDRQADWLVVEVSSFQLEHIHSFRPEIGILLNVHPNHLDRHGSMKTYRQLKANLFRNMGVDDLCLAPEEEMESLCRLSRGQGAWESFGTSKDARHRYVRGAVVLSRKCSISIRGSFVDNRVLGPAAAAIFAAALRVGVEPDQAAASLGTFEPLPHRMQEVCVFGGVTYINDSKATCLHSMMAGLMRSRGRIRLIAGGRAKQDDFFVAKDALTRHVARAYLIGEDAKSMVRAWRPEVDCVLCDKLDEAFRQASSDARSGDTVLLSPGCASFDQFSGYAERGERFMELVLKTERVAEDLRFSDSKLNAMDNLCSSSRIHHSNTKLGDYT